MDIRPIRSDADHATALVRIDQLWGADPDSATGAELEVLITLVDAYETAHHPIPESDPISVVEFVMEQRGLSRRDLEPMIGTRARVAEILNRKRPLTLPATLPAIAEAASPVHGNMGKCSPLTTYP